MSGQGWATHWTKEKAGFCMADCEMGKREIWTGKVRSTLASNWFAFLFVPETKRKTNQQWAAAQIHVTPSQFHVIPAKPALLHVTHNVIAPAQALQILWSSSPLYYVCFQVASLALVQAGACHAQLATHTPHVRCMPSGCSCKASKGAVRSTGSVGCRSCEAGGPAARGQQPASRGGQPDINAPSVSSQALPCKAVHHCLFSECMAVLETINVSPVPLIESCLCPRMVLQERELAAREKKAGKEMASASKLVNETVKRNNELSKLEAEVCLCVMHELHQVPDISSLAPHFGRAL
eukprot:1151218-Pelagomonas_calceolata.AAC.2